jgi:hypothetical protein
VDDERATEKRGVQISEPVQVTELRGQRVRQTVLCHGQIREPRQPAYLRGDEVLDVRPMVVQDPADVEVAGR